MKKLLVISCLIAVLHLRGQNQPLFALYDVCKSYYNPAFTAFDGKTSMYFVGSYQYLAYSNYVNILTKSPERFHTLDISSPIFIKGKQKFSIGLNYSRQDRLYEGSKDLRLNLAFRQKVGKGKKILFGANVDRIQTQFDYPEVNGRHMYIPFHMETWQTFNTGIGLAYHSAPRNFQIGISYSYLVPHKLHSDYFGTFSFSKDLYVMSSIDIKLNKNIKIMPSILLNQHHVISLRPNILAEYKQKYMFGITYLSVYDQGGIRLGYKTKSININYHYELPLTRIMSVSSGTHTLGLNYVFNRKNDYKVARFDRLLP